MLKWETRNTVREIGLNGLNSYVKFDVLHNLNELTKSCGETAPDGK